MKAWTLALAFPLLLTGCSSCEKEKTGAAAEPVASSASSFSPGPGADPECEKLCRINGRCKAKDGKCFAVRDLDCMNCAGCRAFGFCTAKDGACVADKAEDCRKSSACEVNGACTLKDGKCVKE